MNPSDQESPAPMDGFALQEVRYSLPVILRELQLERSLSHFAKEILDQTEITKLFDQARKARAKRR